jgi:hypothetical protein
MRDVNRCYYLNVIAHILTPSMTVVGGRRRTADEQHNTSPPFRVLDAFRVVANWFRPPGDIQCLQIKLETPAIQNTSQK